MKKRTLTLGLLVFLAGLTQAASRTRGRARKPPVDKGPAETRAERDRRLQRECRGKPNAGACEGYGN